MAENKLVQLKDVNANPLFPKVISSSIPTKAVSKAQLGSDVTDILDSVATDANLKALESKVNTLNGDKTVAGSVDKKIADVVSNLVGSAPDTLNTLQKIATELQNPANNTATTVLDQVASKAENSALNSEISRAKAAEKANADGVAANKSAIATLNGSATTTGSVAKAVADAKSTLQTNINNEAATARAAEKNNADNISAEITRAKAAESANTTLITNLKVAAVYYEEVTA